MKKLVLLLAVAFSVSMFSCGGGDAEKKVDSDSLKAAEAAAAQAPEAQATTTEEAPVEVAPVDSAAATQAE
ncbi:MAG: hypothetical protein J6C44_10230 [Muribaculaceae bacterium]|nr:hypothetical protein [Muribaculaceae bacterium]